jgi:protein disulfide-isomerase
MTKQGMALVHLRANGDKTHADFKSSVEKYGQKAGIALVDAEKDKVIHKAGADTAPGDIIAAVRKALPPVDYDGSWLEDYDKAAKISFRNGKVLFVHFTGSDWCSWCVKLDKEIFSTEEFKSFAKSNLVLVKLDFPKNKKPAPEVMKRNSKLARKFGVRGFPTIIVVNSMGKQIGKMGYMKGGPQPFLEELKRIIKK